MTTETAWVRTLGAEVVLRGDSPYRTRCLRAGDGDAPPLILLSGVGGHVETYLKNVNILATRLDNREVYAIDHIGHGFSSTSTDLTYTFEDYANQIEHLLETLDYESAHIHGESLGSMIAAYIGINRPELVETIGLNTPAALMQLDPPGVTEEEIKETKEDFDSLFDRTKEMLDKGISRETVRQRLDWLFVDETPSDELVEIRYKIYRRDGVQAVMEDIYQTVQAVIAGDRHLWSQEEFRNLQAPTLFIYSKHNPGEPEHTASFAANLLPNSEYHLYENSAHWPQWEEPKLFNKHTAEFIQRHSD